MGFYMNNNKEAKRLTFWRGSEVSQGFYSIGFGALGLVSIGFRVCRISSFRLRAWRLGLRIRILLGDAWVYTIIE